MTKLRLKQTTKQKFTLQQLQYISLLPVSNVDMQQKVTEELIDNPLLEEEEVPTLEEDPEEKEIWVEEKVLPKSVDYTRSSKARSPSMLDNFIQSQPAQKASFQEMLYRQVQFLSLGEKAELIAKHIIGSLTKQGFLSCGVDMIVTEMAVYYGKTVTTEEVEAVRKQIQQLGPPGITAYDLQECLLLQLKEKQSAPVIDLAIEVITKWFLLFTKKTIQKDHGTASLDDLHFQKSP